jgi:large subunit ribosomal protein L4
VATQTEKKIKKFDLQGKEVGVVAIDERLASAEANSQMIKDYIVAIRANARQWSANTKGRSEVSHSTKKPHAQKGGGRSRQGSLSAPQYKGGGRVFGPKPKFDQHVRINKKEKQAAIRALIAQKIEEDRLIVLENSQIADPKTKVIFNFLKARNVYGSVLFLGEGSFIDISVEDMVHRFSIPCDTHDHFVKSLRNIPGTKFKLATNISGYDVVANSNIVITEAALGQLQQWLLGDK